MENFFSGNEKRRSPRFKIEIPVEYRKLKESGASKKGSLSFDISQGGIRFVTDEFLAFTARLVLDVDLPLPERRLFVLSKVAWIKKLSAGDTYEIGNQFLEMSKDDKSRFAKYLDKVAASQDNPR